MSSERRAEQRRGRAERAAREVRAERDARDGRAEQRRERDGRPPRTAREAQTPVPIWARPEPRTRRPRHSREQIAAAAVAVADRDGFEAVSMRRVAQELRAGTMTLYHYVSTKQELLMLMSDALMADVLVPPDELPDDWRAAITVIARRSRDVILAHPWAMEALRSVAGGPNSLRHFEQSLAAVAPVGLTDAERLELVFTIDDYVFGYVVRELEARESAGAQAVYDTLPPEVVAYLDELIATGDFPNVAGLVGADPDARAAWRRTERVLRDPVRFERGLGWLLDGFERELARRRNRPG